MYTYLYDETEIICVILYIPKGEHFKMENLLEADNEYSNEGEDNPIVTEDDQEEVCTPRLVSLGDSVPTRLLRLPNLSSTQPKTIHQRRLDYITSWRLI